MPGNHIFKDRGDDLFIQRRILKQGDKKHQKGKNGHQNKKRYMGSVYGYPVLIKFIAKPEKYVVHKQVPPRFE